MDLVTLEEYKEAESKTSSKEDDRISALITSTSSLVKAYCGFTFIEYFDSDKTETFSSRSPRTGIQLTECPVVSITTIKEKALGASSFSDALTADTGFLLESHTDSVVKISNNCVTDWPAGTVEVVYRGGYAETPFDVKLAVYDLVTHYLNDEHKPSFTLMGSTVQFHADKTWPSHIKKVLDLYRVI